MLGFVSMLADISSEMIHSLLPMFMVAALGASAVTVGLVEGLGEWGCPVHAGSICALGCSHGHDARSPGDDGG